MARMKRMSWSKLEKLYPDSCLRDESGSGQKEKYEFQKNSGYSIYAGALTYYQADNHWFSGRDDDFVVIDDHYGTSYLLYDCDWTRVCNYIRRKGFKLVASY